MSVRRLAEDTIQPSGFQFSDRNAEWAETTIRKYPEGRQQSAVIPLLMRAQEQEGWVTKAAIESVADMLGMPYIRALEVATFYTQFQLKPVGSRAHVQVCGTTPCMLRGSESLMDVCRNKIHHDQFETNEDGTLSWEEVECQGACVNAPMVMIFKDTYEDLTPDRLEEIIARFEAGKGDEITPGPQVDRIYSAPVGGPTTLHSDEEIKAASRPVETVKGKAKTEPKKKPEVTDGAAVKVASNPTMKIASSARSVGNGSQADASVGRQPDGIAKPKSPDDLKMISGVGAKIEEKLHDLGIWTWKQIADWKAAECNWVDAHLSFHGRIGREDWVRQAKALAKGGEAEYAKVFGKAPR